MTTAVIAKITCPHCGNEAATVHRAAGRKKSLYYRCYGGKHGDCGTVQITLEGGQKWIKDNMTPLEGAEVIDAVSEVVEEAKASAKAKAISDIRKTQKEKQTKSSETPENDKPPEPKKQGGIFGSFLASTSGDYSGE